MKKEEDLLKNLVEMVKETKMKKLKWKLDVSTTEYNERSQKPIVQEDGKVWTVDECYVAYYCERQGKEFLMITCRVSEEGSPDPKGGFDVKDRQGRPQDAGGWRCCHAGP